MGKYAQYLKRGRAFGQGFLVAPLGSDWSFGVITATAAAVNRLVSIPPGADRWIVLVVNAATGAIAFQNSSNGTPISATPLTTLTTYRAQIAWEKNLARVSDYSPPVTFTTP